MPDLVLSRSTAGALEQFAKQPTHALVVIGPKGAGKFTIATELAAKLLTDTADKVLDDARVLAVTGKDTIGIDDVRNIQHFFALKPASKDSGRRVVLIENADNMTPEAQNALLKAIEEPPVDSYLILTASSSQRLLPTVMSRVQVLNVSHPEKALLIEHFSGQSSQEVERAYLLSGGLPGAMASLLNGDETHPAIQAASVARNILQATRFERLIMVDSLSKDRQAAVEVCSMLGQMASISLKKTGLAAAQQERWRHILTASTEAADQLRKNGNTKLILTALMVTL
jgi:replication-associated recombination protein RarA